MGKGRSSAPWGREKVVPHLLVEAHHQAEHHDMGCHPHALQRDLILLLVCLAALPVPVGSSPALLPSPVLLSCSELLQLPQRCSWAPSGM